MVSVDGAMPRKDVKIYYFNLRKEAKEGKFLQEDQAKDSKDSCHKLLNKSVLFKSRAKRKL